MNLIEEIWKANKDRRKVQDPARRVIKLAEEMGECAQAYLSVTSEANEKNKTWKDVMEEAIDTAIVALDIAMTDNPEIKDKKFDEIEKYINNIINVKLEKWVGKQKRYNKSE